MSEGAPRRGQQDSEEEPPVAVDSAGVYEGLSAEDLGYGELTRVADDAPKPEDG